MTFDDWLYSKLCKGLDRVEKKVDNFIRKGDALFGLEEYDDASASERISGLLGAHDDGIFKKKKNKKQAGLETGDIIGVLRTSCGVNYEHFGVYIGNKKVIHYSSANSDIGGDNKIIESSFSSFLKSNEKFFILIFPDNYGEPSKSSFSASKSKVFMPYPIKNKQQWLSLWKFLKKCNYNLYSPSETVRRARSRLGEKKYNLIVNNCEHFAIWCKTGISESHQVNKIINLLSENDSVKYFKRRV